MNKLVSWINRTWVFELSFLDFSKKKLFLLECLIFAAVYLMSGLILGFTNDQFWFSMGVLLIVLLVELFVFYAALVYYAIRLFAERYEAKHN